MSRKKTFNEFLEEANIRYNNKFLYDETTYKDSHTKIKIICPEHGEFWQIPRVHLKYKNGCPKCSYKDRGLIFRKTTEQFIEDAIKIHGNKYDYSKVNYVKAKEPILIICPEHGEFQQVPNYHLNGKGCPKCNFSHLEREVKDFLNDNNIDYIYQYKNKKLKKQSLDFYLPKYNIGIECQGKQHFGFGGWVENYDFEKNFKLDKQKHDICIDCGIKLIYIIPNFIIPKEKTLYNKNFIKIKNLKNILKWLI